MVENQEPGSKVTRVAKLDMRPKEISLRRFRLMVTDGPQKGLEQVLDKDLVRLGALDDNDVMLVDPTVSRYHAELFVDKEGGFILRDLGSTNGTWVEGFRVREVYLKPDTIFRLGNSSIRFHYIAERLEIFPSQKERFGSLIGRSLKMREVFGLLEKISPTDVTILIGGETGTGKELVARASHQFSRRSRAPFVVFDCGAVPETLIESELFGHEKGSFTGASMSRPGVFEAAEGGTVFLDEIGELSLDLQPKLLRVLEQREVRRVGSNRTQKIDVRVVAATNRDLREEVKQGRFREDLFYRLAVVQVALPAIRERKDDIPLLIRHFLKEQATNRDSHGNQRCASWSPEVEERLMAYHWPGNVRELYNVVERACSLAEASEIQVHDLPDYLREEPDRRPIVGLPVFKNLPFKDAKERVIELFEKEYLVELLKRNELNISRAAREAKMDRKSISRLLKKHDIRLAGLQDDEGAAVDLDDE